MFYFLIGCVTLSVVLIGATYAYFTASDVDENTVRGRSESVSFKMSVQRVTTIDMAYGLIPMKNNQAPAAAYNKCRDSGGNAGCQMYKITVETDSDMVMFLDGYVEMTPKDGVETRITNVYSDDAEATFYTKYTADDFLKEDFDEGAVIKSGICQSELIAFNHEDDYDCWLIDNQQIGGDYGTERVFYIMIWVFDNGQAQDYLQGMELAYTGRVVLMTAQGNEISATFD